MLVKYVQKSNSLEFQDDISGRLKASRLLSLLIFCIGAIKLALLDWSHLTEYDYVFIILEVVFGYLVYVNFFRKTMHESLDVAQISYFKQATGMKSKAYFKLKNGRTRELFNMSSKKQRELVYKEVLKSGIAIK